MSIATAGNKGKSVRSDCFVSLEIREQGGLDVEVISKVKVLYGESIQALGVEILQYFGITHAYLCIEDSGALPLVLAARIEAAIKQLIQTERSFLLPINLNHVGRTSRERFRFSRLYLPGNTPNLMINAGIHQADGIILDLEDAVAPEKKHEARFLVRNALRGINFYGCERMVRINQFPLGLDDLEYVVPHHVNLILLPKCESSEQIQLLNHKLSEIKKQHSISQDIWLMPIIESALGVMKAFEIACAAENIVAMAIGLEDYTADLGVGRSLGAQESFFARSMIVNACKAAGIQPIDSVFSDVADMEGLLENVSRSKQLGFEGMGCIHPRQIKVIRSGFGPEAGEIEKAKKIVNAFIQATEQGLGVVSLGTKMIDPPVVKRAEKTIQLAIDLGLLQKNWRENQYEEV